MGRVNVLLSVIIEDLAKMEEIAFEGKASNGYRQSLQYCIDKAFNEFIKKYEEK